ncbi:hypothetical protein B4U84_14545 [Westiellopsis prolifica IICB1]|nr:hypothetical protein B4U84_14545 [Westiellopsis prolifica IICB1]
MKGKSKQLVIDAYDITNAGIQVAIDFVVDQPKDLKGFTQYLKMFRKFPDKCELNKEIIWSDVSHGLLINNDYIFILSQNKFLKSSINRIIPLIKNLYFNLLNKISSLMRIE